MKQWHLISLAAARNLAIETLAALPRQFEEVGLQNALDRIVAHDVINHEDNPAFDRSTVDGYAVRCEDLLTATVTSPVLLQLVGEVRMGREIVAQIGPGQAIRIPTGGMLPVGADAVLMQEYTFRQDEHSIQAMRPVQRCENIIARGDDVAAGAIVLSAGRRIGAPELGVLASCGFARVQVVKKPVATIVTTGDEIVPPEVAPQPGQIRDVNSFTLAALSETAGCEVIHAPRVPDSLAGLSAVLQAALQNSDLILISGGSSVGDRDFTTVAVQSLPGVKTLFHGVALKPGKPTLMAMLGNTAIFGIPGHTVAAMTVFHEIIEPALAARMGMPCSDSRFVISARLGARLRSDAERDEIVRVRLEQTGDGVVAWPLPAKSGLITVMTRAQGMIYIPAGQPERQIGEMVDVQVLVGQVCGNWRGVSQ